MASTKRQISNLLTIKKKIIMLYFIDFSKRELMWCLIISCVLVTALVGCMIKIDTQERNQKYKLISPMVRRYIPCMMIMFRT